MSTNIEAAQAARRNTKIDRDWADVQASKRLSLCQCDLRKGMSWEELCTLGQGCTRPDWVCSTLDLYRRLVGFPPLVEEV